MFARLKLTNSRRIMTIQATENETVETQLLREIDNLVSQISELKTYLSSLKSQPVFEAIQGLMSPQEIIKAAQQAARQQRSAAEREAEAQVITQSILGLQSQLFQKRQELGELKNKELFGQLMVLAQQYNAAIDLAVSLLEQMRDVDQQLGGGRLEVVADSVRSMPYSKIYGSVLKIRLRSQILRE